MQVKQFSIFIIARGSKHSGDPPDEHEHHSGMDISNVFLECPRRKKLNVTQISFPHSTQKTESKDSNNLGVISRFNILQSQNKNIKPVQFLNGLFAFNYLKIKTKIME